MTDKNRFNILVHKTVFLFGHDSEVVYYFFDNMLYGYQISLAAYDLEKPHKEILETLRGQFGEGKNGRTKNPDLIYSFNWDTEKQTVSYWMTKKHGPAATDDWKTKEPTDPNTWGPDPFVKTYYVYAWSQYEPFFKQIEDVAKNEKKTYF